MTANFSQDPAGLGNAEAACVTEPARPQAFDRAPPVRPTLPTGWRTRTLVGTGVLAFFAGALVWHLVGFWSFLSGIVFNPQGGETITRPQTVRDGSSSTKAAGYLTANPGGPAAAAPKSPTPPAHTQAAPVVPPAAAATEVLAELLQCTVALKSSATHLPTLVQACPPLRQRLPLSTGAQRADRQLDAREAANRLANGWQTGVSQIETGSIRHPR